MGSLSQPLTYMKAIIAAVGANVFPPIVMWLVTFIPGDLPADVKAAISIFLVAVLTGGATFAVSNKNAMTLEQGQVVVAKTETMAGATLVAEHKS